MARQADPALAAKWHERIQRQALEEGSIEQFCRREGVSTAAFYAWRKRLAGGGRRSVARSRRARSLAPQRPEDSPRFVSLPLPASLAASGASHTVEIELPNGVVVRLPADCAAALLREALQAASAALAPDSPQTQEARRC